ncbi:MAG: tetratricopeptide repeat protein [Candidatus Margulisiibacteriota bacterium]
MVDLKDIKDALRKNPDNPWALKGVARHYLSDSNYKQAADYYTQAVRLSFHLLPDVIVDYESAILKTPEKTGLRLSLAGFYLSQGDVDSALLELEEILDVNPKCTEAYNIIGKIFIRQEKTDEAIALLEKSVKEGIIDVALTEILAGAYLEKGRINDAVKFYAEVLSHRPGDKQVLRTLGELYARLTDYVAAAKAYQAMYSDDPEVAREVILHLEDLLKKIEGSVFIREALAEIYVRSLMPDAAAQKLREIILLDSAKLESVIAQLKGILKTYPSHPAATLVLAEAFCRQGGFSEAAESYHDLIKSNPELTEEGIKGYQTILELCPGQILARQYLADAFFKQGKIKEALAAYAEMLEKDPSIAETVIQKCREMLKDQPQLAIAHLVLGRAYLVKGDFQRAITEADGMILADKKYTPAYLLQGDAYLNSKSLRKAAEVLKQALSFDPYNALLLDKYQAVKEQELEAETKAVKARLSEDPWKVSLHFDLAKLYIQKDLSEEAIRELQLALKDQTRAPFACNLLGSIYRGDGRYDLAAAQFSRALELTSPDVADFGRVVRFNLGSTYEAQGLIQKALKTYESILQEDIDFADLKKRAKNLKNTSLQSLRNRLLVMVPQKYGRNNVVAFWGREARTFRPGRKEEISVSFGQTHNVAGYDYYLKGMYKAALEEFQLAVQLDNSYSSAVNNLGVALSNDNRHFEARKYFEQAVDYNPNSAIFRTNLAVVYLMLGQTEKARKELEKARELDPELMAISVNLADVYYTRGEIEKALQLYRSIGEFDYLKEIAERRLLFKVSG